MDRKRFIAIRRVPEYRRLIQEGVTFDDLNSVFVSMEGSQNIYIARGTHIHPHTFFVGKIEIGNDCVIGPDAYIEESMIGEASEIGFTSQIKSSYIGKRFRAKHHCYIGNARIGDDVNIGAGFITANYDGTRKNETEIGNGAFIGVNVNVIAPINIGREAIVAAGSTITEDVRPHSLVVARARAHASEGTYHRKTEWGYEQIKIGAERLHALKKLFDPESLYWWLITPQHHFGDRVPIDLIRTGKSHLIDEWIRQNKTPAS